MLRSCSSRAGGSVPPGADYAGARFAASLAPDARVVALVSRRGGPCCCPTSAAGGGTLLTVAVTFCLAVAAARRKPRQPRQPHMLPVGALGLARPDACPLALSAPCM